MNKFLKLSTTALLLSGLAMSGSAFAAFKSPTIRADKMTVDVNGDGYTVDVAANDLANDGTELSYKAGKARYGRVACTTTGSCTYTPTTKAKGKKTDSFKYTVSYKDAKGKTRKKTSRVRIKLATNCVSC